MSELTKEFPWLESLKPVASGIVDTLFEKEIHYRGSWQKRGGVGAYMMTARKTDRIEGIVEKHGYDIFAAMNENTGGIIDDIDDLIGYLLLVRAKHELDKVNGAEPTGAYVNQGGDK